MIPGTIQWALCLLLCTLNVAAVSVCREAHCELPEDTTALLQYSAQLNARKSDVSSESGAHLVEVQYPGELLPGLESWPQQDPSAALWPQQDSNAWPLQDPSAGLWPQQDYSAWPQQDNSAILEQQVGTAAAVGAAAGALWTQQQGQQQGAAAAAPAAAGAWPDPQADWSMSNPTMDTSDPSQWYYPTMDTSEGMAPDRSLQQSFEAVQPPKSGASTSPSQNRARFVSERASSRNGNHPGADSSQRLSRQIAPMAQEDYRGEDDYQGDYRSVTTDERGPQRHVNKNVYDPVADEAAIDRVLLTLGSPEKKQATQDPKRASPGSDNLLPTIAGKNGLEDLNEMLGSAAAQKGGLDKILSRFAGPQAKSASADLSQTSPRDSSGSAVDLDKILNNAVAEKDTLNKILQKLAGPQGKTEVSPTAISQVQQASNPSPEDDLSQMLRKLAGPEVKAANSNPDVQGFSELLRSLTSGSEVSEVKPKPDHSHDLSQKLSEALNPIKALDALDKASAVPSQNELQKLLESLGSSKQDKTQTAPPTEASELESTGFENLMRSLTSDMPGTATKPQMLSVSAEKVVSHDASDGFDAILRSIAGVGGQQATDAAPLSGEVSQQVAHMLNQDTVTVATPDKTGQFPQVKELGSLDLFLRSNGIGHISIS